MWDKEDFRIMEVKVRVLKRQCKMLRRLKLSRAELARSLKVKQGFSDSV